MFSLSMGHPKRSNVISRSKLVLKTKPSLFKNIMLSSVFSSPKCALSTLTVPFPVPGHFVLANDEG